MALIRDEPYNDEMPFYSSICALLKLLYKIGIDSQTSSVNLDDAVGFIMRTSNERTKKNVKKKSALYK